MSQPNPVHRRDFLNQSLAAAGTAGMMAAASDTPAKAADAPQAEARSVSMSYGMIGKVKISRLLLGGNLISGFMHSRDLKYVNALFRAYATKEKIIDTLRVADECGVNTVFETGANFVQEYNKKFGRSMQFIPHIQVKLEQTEQQLVDHIKKQVDSGAAAIYVWGVAADTLIQAGEVGRLGRAVELAKKHDLPVGVGGHSLLVPQQCEKAGVPCDFYVKTLHSDDYPSATPKEKRKEFIWLNGGPGWYDNMWCINPEETVEFMKTVTKPWLAFKVLAAGAFLPQQGFSYAFKSGADFIAVGMLDFQIRANSELIGKMVRLNQNRPRPWRA